MCASIINEFEKYIRTECGLSPNTISAYVRDIKEFLDFIGTPKLTAPLIETFINHLKQQQLKSTTIRRKCMSVRCLCHHLISLGHLDPNILETINSIRTERNKPDVLDSKDVDALVSTVEKRLSTCGADNVRRNVAVILTLYHSGLRVSELCGLNLDDINIIRREIRVGGKGSRDRIVPTTQECIEAIEKYLDSREQSDIKAVFIKSNRQRITRRGISDMLTSLSRRAGVKHTTSHTLRRSCATSLMENGMDLECVQALLGHQHLSTTETYLVVNDDRLKDIHTRCHPFGGEYAKEKS